MKGLKNVYKHVKFPWVSKKLILPNKSNELFVNPNALLNNISIVTGTLNRLKYLPDVIANTVDSDSRLELVLVDGGSTDGTIEYVKNLNHPRIKLIEVGGKSSYPHFMNLGIRNASHELVCQWNDDVFLVNKWDDVFKTVEDNDLVIFSWKKDYVPKYYDKNWILLDDKRHSESGHIVVNFGIYKKNVFRKIGLYNKGYHFYYADADMTQRTWYNGFKIKSDRNIKVISVKEIEKPVSQNSKLQNDYKLYIDSIELYKKKGIPENTEFL